ncbi:uncharacterized protein TNCV_4227391 [Trichonephila clavipes]|nr:uncharacterized protein TNCV_4227391 [Trichonephila clavipes]
MADRTVFMLGSISLLLCVDKRRQASRRSFEAGILTSRKVYSEESEWKSESFYWLMKSEDNGSGKMAAHVGCVSVSGVVTDVQARFFNVINNFVRQDGVEVDSRVSGDESIYSTVNMVVRVGVSVMISVFRKIIFKGVSE